MVLQPADRKNIQIQTCSHFLVSPASWMQKVRTKARSGGSGLERLDRGRSVDVCFNVWIYSKCVSMERKSPIKFFPPQAGQALLDVGEILVGSYRSVDVPLVNKSPCSVSFCLSVQQRLLDDDPTYDPESAPSGTLFLQPP